MSDTARISVGANAGSVKLKTARNRFHNFQLFEPDNALLQQLSEQHRQILIIHGSYAEMAQQLNLAPGTVRSRLHRARKALTRLRGEADGDHREPDLRSDDDPA